MQLKLILSVCIIAACTMCGRAITSAAERRCRMLGDLLRALKSLQVQICILLKPLKAALHYTEFPLFAIIADRLSDKSSAEDAWAAARMQECRKGQSADCLNDRDLAILDSLFEHLGECDRDSQNDMIQGCITSAETVLNDAIQRCWQISRLYTSIGFLIGLAAAVLLI